MVQRTQSCLSVLTVVGKTAQHRGYGHWPLRNRIAQRPASQVFLCPPEAIMSVTESDIMLQASCQPAAGAGQEGVGAGEGEREREGA